MMELKVKVAKGQDVYNPAILDGWETYQSYYDDKSEEPLWFHHIYRLNPMLHP